MSIPQKSSLPLLLRTFQIRARRSFQGMPGRFRFSQRVDYTVAGLVINFVPDDNLVQAMTELTRVTRSGGTVTAYVWDYLGEMQMMRHLWDAAIELDPSIAQRDEGSRFSHCQPGPLAFVLSSSGLAEVEVRAISVPTEFTDFDDYWSQFLTGVAPAPGYPMSLGEHARGLLREAIRARLPTQIDGSIPIIARAWAVRGLKPRHL